MNAINAKFKCKNTLYAVFLCVMAFPLMAQEEDITATNQSAPVFIQEPEVIPASASNPLSIAVAVTDDIGVRYVTVYYRFGRIAPLLQIGGNGKFKRLNMTVNRDGEYVVYMQKQRVRGNILEYYMEVTDVEGNTSYSGSATQPKVVTFLTTQVASNIATIPEPTAIQSVQLIAPVLEPIDQSQVIQPKKDDDKDKPIVAWHQNRWLWAAAGAVVLGVALGGSDSSSAPTGSVTVTGPSL